jgi:uncharacterized repeat protein (TIGR03943 family)
MTARSVRATLLLGFALLIAKIFFAGQMVRYMAPALDPLTVLTAFVLAAMGAVELGGVRPSRRIDDASGQEQAATGFLLAIPIVIGLLLAPKALGSSMFGDEDLTRIITAVGPSAVAPRRDGQSASEEPVENIPEMAAYLRQDGDRPVGRRARAVGLGVRGMGLGLDELALIRFSIVHCVADAQPLGLLVVTPDAATWERDQWVQVEGILETRERSGARLVTIVADSIVPIEEPRNPYLTQ